MSKTSGCILILAGLAVGGYALHSELMAGTEMAAALVRQVVEGDGAAPKVLAEAGGPTSLAGAPGKPGNPDLPPAPKPAPDASKDESSGSQKGAPPAPGLVPPMRLVPPVPVPAKRPRTAVAAVKVDDTPPRVPVGEINPGERPRAPVGPALTREIQTELRRVGCYRGPVTGVWTPSVREAMREFTKSANATLPVEKPDPVLLAMVKSHPPGVCSNACPQGQERAAHGRCVPGVLAGVKGGVKTKTISKASAYSAKQPPAAPSAGPPSGATAGAPDGRMSLAGPPIASPPQARRHQAGPRRQHRAAVRRAYRPSPYKSYSGWPSWALPFFTQ